MIKPIRDKLVVKLQDYSEMTPGGIIIPHQRLDAKNYIELVKAEVIAISDGYCNKDGTWIVPPVKVKDWIMYGGKQYTGVEYEENGTSYRIIRFADILLKINKE